jgi:hypothetical protein
MLSITLARDPTHALDIAEAALVQELEALSQTMDSGESTEESSRRLARGIEALLKLRKELDELRERYKKECETKTDRVLIQELLAVPSYRKIAQEILSPGGAPPGKKTRRLKTP